MPGPPHLPALKPEYELEPPKVRTHWDKPLDAISYKVTDADTLANLAVRTGLSAKYLMNYAFGTSDPRHVNWYLRMVVGCKKYGPQGKNYAFSNSADPGTIWLPRNAYIRLTKKPPLSPGNHTCGGLFPRFYQTGSKSNCCWAVAGATLYEWKNKQNRSVSKALADIGSEWTGLYDNNNYLIGPQFKRFAASVGLRPLALGNFLEDHYWVSRLDQGKPFLILQKSTGAWTHWIIAIGYEIDADHKLSILYQDPGDGRRYSSSADYLYSKSIDALTQVSKVWSA